ncbi:Inducer of phenazine A [Lentzea flava]|uniref:GDSL-like Lipase/Acylhydrolase family protein n=1 Tax=Lentzea flava TaxID=103732 RepID=A0ABQ2VHM8_9PSEU|nr:Inducer of phenazine A [Lentzea flava]MCP2205192.1 hypothetical protein [Lentzea flava]GGU84550.1 hypothetical protein GCM10010178_88550 [Lentzea flava]
MQGDHGAFFFCSEYYELMEALRARHRKAGRRWWGRNQEDEPGTDPEPVPQAPLPELITRAAALAGRHLDGWRQLAAVTGARITCVLSPMAYWVRDRHAEQETLLFRELDKLAALGVTLEEQFGEITTMDAGHQYAEALRVECEKQDVRFLNISPELAKVTTTDDWLFVDRGHFTDHGHALIAELLADRLSLT